MLIHTHFSHMRVGGPHVHTHTDTQTHTDTHKSSFNKYTTERITAFVQKRLDKNVCFFVDKNVLGPVLEYLEHKGSILGQPSLSLLTTRQGHRGDRGMFCDPFTTPTNK